MNSQPIKSLLRDLQIQQLFPMSSQPMGSLLSNLQGKKLVPVNSQPIKSLLRDLQSQQLVPMNSQSMVSPLSNLLNNNHYRFQKHRKSGILNHTLLILPQVPRKHWMIRISAQVMGQMLLCALNQILSRSMWICPLRSQ